MTWNMLGLTWGSGATWNGVIGNKSKSMNTKAIIDFSGYTAGDLGPAAQMIHDKMTANAATFTAPPLTMAALQTLLTSYGQKLVARASRATTDLVAFNTARAALEDTLGALGNYVNGVAKGDLVIVELSGFPSYATTHATDNTPPAAPTDLRLRQGALRDCEISRIMVILRLVLFGGIGWKAWDADQKQPAERTVSE